MKISFVIGQGISQPAEKQLSYLLDELGRAAIAVEPIHCSAEIERPTFDCADAVLFVGDIPAEVTSAVCQTACTKIYWALDLRVKDLDAYGRLRRLVTMCDIVAAPASTEADLLEQITRTPVELIGIGVPQSINSGQPQQLVIADNDRLGAAEAMSAGKVVTLSGSHDLAALVLDGVNGFIARSEPDEPKRIDPEDLERMSAEARATWSRNWRVQDLATRMCHLVARAAQGEFQKSKTNKSYERWVECYDTIREQERTVIRRCLRSLPRHPLISILLPVFNPELEVLSATIDSVRRQIYPRWQLCIADDASTEARVADTLREIAASDRRIELTLREQNGHIAACSNSALQLATGEWVALLDHDDLLAEHALAFVADRINAHPNAGLIYSDEDKIDDTGMRCRPYFKSDWNPELLLGQNFINHLGVYRRSLLEEVGGFREGFEGSQDYDLVLRCVERLSPDQIQHIPRVLYHWRMVRGSVAHDAEAKPYAPRAARRAIHDFLARNEIKAEVTACAENLEWHRVIYELPDPAPLVSVIIPTRDRVSLLRQCIASLRERTVYSPFEIIIVDNDSVQPESRSYFNELTAQNLARVVSEAGQFNFSRLINRGAREARGEILLLLNNDIEAHEGGWLREMVSHAVRPQVGAVGARLWFPNGTLQHAGVITGPSGIAGHAFHRLPPMPIARMNRTFVLAQNYSAVTAACMATPKSVFENVGGFDEALPSNYNDVDFCLRLRQRNWQIVWTPYANLTHHESASRGLSALTQNEKLNEELAWMTSKWGDRLFADPYYSPNLSLTFPSFELAFPPRVAPLNSESWVDSGR